MSLFSSSYFWLAVGFIGPILFSMRFFVQWIASEKKKSSVVPVSFWYYSIAGGVVLLVYAIHQNDPVFIAGQGLGVLIYARNLYLIHCRPKKEALSKIASD
jgi:lipid-A-disaccharide synthase-like uncharacterized protein